MSPEATRWSMFAHRLDTAESSPRADRLQAWKRLSQDLDVQKLELLVEEIAPALAPERAALFLEGRVRGRIVVDVNR